ncbi:LysR substrate-binding domain-containing protein [Streptomyces sp. NPDC001795]|uniref:LysR family transcriptional regulator n=1 Tax=Streptomyces sp. NPDC001795 TaxID=3154525 RepID=UPI0033202469
MSGLERQLGVKLLVRGSTGVGATEAGTALLAEARAVLAPHDQALRAMARYTGPGGGALRIGIPLELPTGLLDPALTELREAHPDTRVQARHLSTAEQLVALHSGEPDVGFLRERPSGPRFDALLVVREKLGVLPAAEQAAEVRRTGRHRAGCARRPAVGRISSLRQPRLVRRTDRDPTRAARAWARRLHRGRR